MPLELRWFMWLEEVMAVSSVTDIGYIDGQQGYKQARRLENYLDLLEMNVK